MRSCRRGLQPAQAKACDYRHSFRSLLEVLTKRAATVRELSTPHRSLAVAARLAGCQHPHRSLAVAARLVSASYFGVLLPALAMSPARTITNRLGLTYVRRARFTSARLILATCAFRLA